MAQRTDGTTITFAESGFSMDIVSIDSLSINGVAIDTVHLGTAAGIRTAIKSSFKEAELSFTCHHDPTASVPMNKDDEEQITVDWGGTGTSDVFNGFFIGLDITGPGPAELLSASVTVKLTSYVSGNLFDS